MILLALTQQELTDALSQGFHDGFRDFLVGSMVAALPMFWIATLVFYLMRPYAIRTLRKLSLRFAADVFWLSYVLIRDGALIITFIVSLFFFYPNLLHDNALPITATLSSVFVLWALLVKMVRDPDESPADYRLSVILLVIGSVLYLVPLTLGVEVTSQSHLSWAATHLSSSTNFQVAIGVFYVSLALVAATGAYIFGYVITQSAPKRAPQPTGSGALAAPPARAR
ncbi:MAG TPA: hypothetical protein VEZ14_05285 [Dehalococcoidia bacterium]|nr:hypothetical protein [Dehalococcoidia bacterium]